MAIENENKAELYADDAEIRRFWGFCGDVKQIWLFCPFRTPFVKQKMGSLPALSDVGDETLARYKQMLKLDWKCEPYTLKPSPPLGCVPGTLVTAAPAAAGLGDKRNLSFRAVRFQKTFFQVN